MAVFRVEKKKDYTVMSKYHLRDDRLSLKAKGLLSLMLSLPDEWDYTLEGLSKINKEGVAAIRTAVQELEAAGYIRRERTRAETGIFEGNDYIIYETPPDSDSPSCENRTLDSPLCSYPTVDNPTLENRTQLNKDIESKDNIPPNPQMGEMGLADLFERFWRAYPRKTDKQRARRAFNRLKASQELVDLMIKAIRIQKESPQWKKDGGQYIPHASTWLNGRRWEDEIPARPSPPLRHAGVIETEEVERW